MKDMIHAVLTSPWLWRIHAFMAVFMLLSLAAQWYIGDVRPLTAFVAGLLVAQQIGRLE